MKFYYQNLKDCSPLWCGRKMMDFTTRCVMSVCGQIVNTWQLPPDEKLTFDIRKYNPMKNSTQKATGDVLNKTFPLLPPPFVINCNVREATGTAS